MNYRMIATQIGDMLKYDCSINEINRVAYAIFRFRKESFANDAITSIRAQLVYDWILSLAKQPLNLEERARLLYQFCVGISSEGHIKEITQFLIDNGIPQNIANRGELNLFLSRNFHSEVVRHCQKLFLQGNYFHAIFEAAKAYNIAVKQKAQSDKDGQSLMMDVWGWANGVLKVTPCQTETDKNVQEGIKFLSGGLMQAIRNPTAHEPAITWPIDSQDCLDILSFISFLYRKLDVAVYFHA